MAGFIPKDNKLVVCPYDEAHKVKESRLQLHIAKCKLNHLDEAKKVCPFNATHLLPVGEYDHHLTTCPDRAPLDRQLAQAVNKNNPFRGRVDVPQYSEPIEDNEVWDIDNHSVQRPPTPPGAVLEPSEFAKPAERRKFYNELHQRASEPQTSSKPNRLLPGSKPVPVQPRQPKQHSLIEDSKHNAQVIENLGLGRGKPISRIAANFPKTESQPQQPVSSATYSSIANDMANLGLGRGKSYRAPAFNFANDDDFPALGCGRGVMNKQNARQPGARPKN